MADENQKSSGSGVAEYRGDEPAIDLKSSGEPVESNLEFECRAPEIPPGAVPIFDDDNKAVIGYRKTLTTGVFQYYDLDGKDAGMEESGLEQPLVDPIDLIFIFAGLAGVFRKGAVKLAAKATTAAATEISFKSISGAAASVLRGLFRRLISARALKFTATTAARMETQGRYVPIHILQLAIRNGRRVPDPQGVAKVFLYTIKMIKNGKTYLLEVIVRETDWTILHFLYK